MIDLGVFCCDSPLARSMRTAEIIWGAREEPIIPEYELREIDLYSFQVWFRFVPSILMAMIRILF